MTAKLQTTSRHSALHGGRWLATLLLISLSAAHAEQPYPIPVNSDSALQTPLTREYSLDGQPGPAESAYNPDLIGFWEYRGSIGSVTLEIISEDIMIASGRRLKYQVLPDVIRVVDDEGEIDYPYQLVNDRLILTMSDGQGPARKITFHRVGLSAKTTDYSRTDEASYR